MESDVYTSVKKEGKGYVFSNANKSLYLMPDVGKVKSSEDLKRVNLSKNYYIEYNEKCDKLKSVDNSKDIKGCIYSYDASKNKDLYIINSSDDDALYLTVLLPNGKVLEYKNKDAKLIEGYVAVGERLYNEFGTIDVIFDKNGNKKDNACIRDLQNHACSDGAYYYFLDNDLDAEKDAYDDISCHKNGYCKISKDGKTGLWYEGKVLIEPIYSEIEINDNYIVAKDSNSFDLLLLREGESLQVDKLQKEKDTSYDNIDVEKVIKDYKLEDIKNLIDENKEFFKKYAYIVINNKGLGNYKPYVMKIFKVIIDNKEYLEEEYFLESLKGLEFGKKDLGDPAGEYNGVNNIVYLDPKYLNTGDVIYHELIHFVDFKIANKGNVKYYCLNNRFLKKEEYLALSKEEKIKALRTGDCSIEANDRLITEAGAEYYNGVYFQDGKMYSYGVPVNIYSTLIAIYGHDTMKEIMFSKYRQEKFLNLFISAGKTKDDYNNFLNNLSPYGIIPDKNISKALDTLVDLYKAKNGNDWLKDNRFCYCLYTIIANSGCTYYYSKYEDEYNKIFNKYDFEFFDNLYKSVKGVPLSALGGPYYYTDGKRDYIMLDDNTDQPINGHEDLKFFKVEYDFNKEKIKN